MSRKAFFLVFTLLLNALYIVPPALADFQTERLSLTPFIGGYTFDGDQDLKSGAVFGLRAGYSLDEHWDIEGLFDYVSTESRAGAGDASSFGYRVDGLYNILPGGRLIPFLAAGLGGNTVDYPDASGKGTKTRGAFNYGGGVKYILSDAWALRGDLRHILVFDKLNRAFGNLEYTLGLNYLFGKTTQPAAFDSDGDGVTDDADKCPDTPKGVSVDRDGCPMDTDGDGVLDYMDKCPDTPKGVSVDREGCPMDTDGDGVLDYLDKCPDTPKGVSVDRDGCPMDTDGDGVLDYMDKCPDTPKGVSVDRYGCPMDTDGDGVLDYMDKCPDTPKGVSVDENGCPPMIENRVMRLNIEFDTDKAEIKPGYFDEIKKVADIMSAYPDMEVEIAGHTDNVGPEEYNRALSLRRAESVKSYLVEKFGIEARRLTAAGYGSLKPVAGNETPEGRQRNRRIEALINYTEVR